MVIAVGSEPPPEDGEGLAIREVSGLLGVPAATVRSWERRYGVPTTPRSPGGHRRYPAAAVQELRLMRDEIARGHRAAQAAQAVRQLRGAGPESGLLTQMLACSQRLDPPALRDVLDQARDELGLAAAIDDVLLPGMRRLGQWWQAGRCDIAQEHLTTEAARGWLSRETATAPAPWRAGPVVLACGPRDLHTLGVEALATLLAHRGHHCRVLGARTPARTLVSAVTATSATAAIVVSHLPTQRRPAVEAIRAAAATGCPLFYAGNAFLFPRARTGVPGTYLGDNLALAADVIDHAVGER